MAFYELTCELLPEQIVPIFEFYTRRARKVLFALPIKDYVTEGCKAFINKLILMGAKEKEVSEWPGTKLFFGKTATIYIVEWSHEFLAYCLATKRDLFAWHQPELPEDVCLIDEQNIPILITTSHEHYVLLYLSDNDVIEWGQNPSLTEILRNLTVVGLSPARFDLLDGG